jgi:hypothetical protein
MRNPKPIDPAKAMRHSAVVVAKPRFLTTVPIAASVLPTSLGSFMMVSILPLGSRTGCPADRLAALEGRSSNLTPA